jgi:hypothetical protein
MRRVSKRFEIERHAGNAMAYSMYAYTFGIVSDEKGGREGRGLGTGIGVCWKQSHLILTAAHTLQTTPYDRLYLFLPADRLQIADSSASADWTQALPRKRCQLEAPWILLAENDDDLAAILLPAQAYPASERHFYKLDNKHQCPSIGTEVGYVGYPSALRQPIGENFAVNPYCEFGDLVEEPVEYDPAEQVLVRYRPGGEVNPEGLSGSGIWSSSSSGPIWAPQLSLAGLVTHHINEPQLLLAYRVESIAAFLTTKESWFPEPDGLSSD